MIDGRAILVYGAWILGLAIVLAAFSYRRWLSLDSGTPLLARGEWRVWCAAAAGLLCAGWVLRALVY